MSAAPPSRSARSLTWAGDSSPVISSVVRSALMERSTLNNNVDLPTPGSPPTSTSEAGTRPPPSTRSSSATPVGMRSPSSALTSTSRNVGFEGAAAPAASSSTSVPKAPQDGHLPNHRPAE